MRWTLCAALAVLGVAAFSAASMGAPWSPSTTVYEYRESSNGEAEAKQGAEGVAGVADAAGAGIEDAPGATGTASAEDATGAAGLDSTIIGDPGIHVARFKDTLLDIARLHHLGYRELVRANPGVDPWLPGDGTRVVLPSRWILPDGPREGLVLNMPEMRLYYYLPDGGVLTFPLGVGVEGQETPAGSYRVGQKRENPTWYVPVSIQQEMEHPRKVVPPGPDNPLGKYWMRLSHTTYGIHGTNNPWAIGRRVTHGCIRLYPEDIAYLYPRVPKDTPVRVVYQHAKVGVRDGRAYFQVYRKGGATDAEGVATDTMLMGDLLRQLGKLGVKADLREIRRLLLDLPDGAMTPVPLRERLMSGTSRPERTSHPAPRSRGTRRTAAAVP